MLVIVLWAPGGWADLTCSEAVDGLIHDFTIASCSEQEACILNVGQCGNRGLGDGRNRNSKLARQQPRTRTHPSFSSTWGRKKDCHCPPNSSPKTTRADFVRLVPSLMIDGQGDVHLYSVCFAEGKHCRRH